MNTVNFLNEPATPALSPRIVIKETNPFLVSKSRTHEHKALMWETVQFSSAGVAIACAVLIRNVGVCRAVAASVALVATQKIQQERKLQQEAVENEKKIVEAVRRESERKQREFTSEMDRLGARDRERHDSGRFMKEYRDPPEPRETGGRREMLA